MPLGETLILRQARMEDAERILEYIRQEDLEEWEASVEGGLVWLPGSIADSTERVCLADAASDDPLVLFGVIDRGPDLPADIWMVASVFGPPRAVAAWHLAIDWIKGFWERWPDVHCWSDARNLVHHRWLEWLGFKCLHVASWGHKGLPFHYYRRQA